MTEQEAIAQMLFERECLPLPGDSLVAAVNRNTEEAGLSEHIGSSVNRWVPWSALRYRKGRLTPGVEPEYVAIEHDGRPRMPDRGDICRVDGDPPGPRIWKEPA